jgi:hypothetical protein
MNWDETRARLIEGGIDAGRLPEKCQFGIDLRWADLHNANLRGADLHGADLHGADLDFSVWPLWCGSLKVIIDVDQARQIAYHLASVLPPEVRGDWVAGLVEFANGWAGIECHSLQEVRRDN